MSLSALGQEAQVRVAGRVEHRLHGFPGQHQVLARRLGIDARAHLPGRGLVLVEHDFHGLGQRAQGRILGRDDLLLVLVGVLSEGIGKINRYV